MTGAAAQVTTGTIYGKITDPSGGVLPGVAVNAVAAETGLPRTAITDANGVYRLPALPHGTYKVTTESSGFRPTLTVVRVDVSANVPLDVKLQLAQQSDTVTVEATALRETGRNYHGQTSWFENLPSNGRHLAAFWALAPGIGGAFHPDSSRSSQPVAQANGNNGRSLYVTFDGGDNYDSVVGAMSQPIPLSAVQEYTFFANRFSAQYGGGNAVVNVITKSGTNQLRGDWFTFMRDDALNARTFNEKKQNVEKQPYGRYQYGGSLGGPVVQSRAHFFAAYERTQQDTKQIVDTDDTLPDDGIYDVPFRQDMFTGKLTMANGPRHYTAIRYAHDRERAMSGVAGNAAASSWAESTNTYHSLNFNHNWQTGRTSVNEFVFQYSSYLNNTPANAAGPAYTLLSGAKGGANANAPQTTEQKRWQFRDDYSWSQSLLGTTHEFRTGVNIIHTPRLFISNQGGTHGILTMRSNDIDGGVDSILLIGGTVQSNIPTDLYGLYFQDDWRVTDRLTLNLGLRYDYLSGIPIEQNSLNFSKMQAAGLTGRFEGTLLEDFGKSPRGDRDNFQPRVGAAFDVFGNGRDMVRGGWGIYHEVSFTNANVLTTSLEGGGIIYSGVCRLGFSADASPWCDPARGFVIPAADGIPENGTLYTARQSALVLGLQTITPTSGEVVSPRLEQPFSYQTNAGWTHDFDRGLQLSVDFVRVQGRNINMRIRPNVDTNPLPNVTTRYLADVGVSPNTRDFRTALSKGRSEYNALIFDVRKRMSNVDLDASYTLSKSTSDVGTAADELTQNLLQDINDPFSAFQLGPSTRVDARHRITSSGIVSLPYDFKVAGTLTFRSALPTTTLEGVDRNLDGTSNDHTLTAYRYTGLNADGSATYEEAGTCETVNCSRRAPFSQVNLRVSRGFRLGSSARIEAMLEVFNVFNARNPFIPTSMNFTSSATFMQPTGYAGDPNLGEQRLAQLGARLSF